MAAIRPPSRSARAVGTVLTFAAALALSPSAHADPKKGVTAVLPLRAAPADEKLAGVLYGPLVEGIASATEDRVLSYRDLQAALDHAATQALAGCDDERCAVDAARALAADRLVVSHVGELGGQVLLSLSLVDAHTAEVLARASFSLGAPAAAAATTKKVAPQLYIPDAERAGDVAVRELRIAVVVEEYKDGNLARVPSVATCAAKALADAGAVVVDATRAASLKKSIDVRQVVGGAPVDSLTSAEVDLLLVGVVDSNKLVTGQTKYGPQGKVVSEMGLRFLQVDTAEVLAASDESVERVFRGAGAETGAIKQAQAGLCAKIPALLAAHLDRRVERGRRLVVTLNGALTVERAADVAARIAATKAARVVRAKVRSVTEGSATVDVVTHGVDGYSCALALAGAGLTARTAGPAELTLALE